MAEALGMMGGYATQTNTPRNLYALRTNGWRLLATPDSLKANASRPKWHDGSPAPFALDNGAWGAHNRKVEWDADAFLAAVDRFGDEADFIVVPDIVAGGLVSLDLSLEWLERLKWTHPAQRYLIPVQDGMRPSHVAGMCSSRVGLFLGGSTDWKLETMPLWGEYCAERGFYLHVGRVNTVNRIEKCAAALAQSFDGTSLTKYASNSERLQWARYCNPSRRHPWQIEF